MWEEDGGISIKQTPYFGSKKFTEYENDWAIPFAASPQEKLLWYVWHEGAGGKYIWGPATQSNQQMAIPADSWPEAINDQKQVIGYLG